jgi:hypothetical protein
MKPLSEVCASSFFHSDPNPSSVRKNLFGQSFAREADSSGILQEFGLEFCLQKQSTI